MLVTDTLVSRSLGATFSELIGQPTPPKLHVPVPTTATPVTETTEPIPLSVASSEPHQTINPTLEAPATAVVQALLPTVTPSES